ncbi:MAG: septum formation initiator family protein [Bacteroidaceae bacterium]|nr:septum formation initiator family protein [Bacteroidaceae bacterium]
MGRLVTIWNLICRHKYWVVTIAFVAIIGVLDENSLLRRAAHKYEIATLKSEIEQYKEQYQEDTRRLEELDSNPETIEKIARERYLMKRPDEDVYIFEE